MFLKISRYFKHSTLLARPTPPTPAQDPDDSIICLNWICFYSQKQHTGTWNRKQLLRPKSFTRILSETRQEWNNSWKLHQGSKRNHSWGIGIIALLLLLKTSRAGSSGLHSDIKPFQVREHSQVWMRGKKVRRRYQRPRFIFIGESGIIPPNGPISQVLPLSPLQDCYMLLL